MSNQWFRLYAELINEPKVLVLTEALRWRYVALLCLQCNGMYENRPDDEIALSLRVTVEEWEFTKSEFSKRGLITKDNKINGWEKRQYISDIKDPTSAERQKRYRDNKRNYRNVSVTSRLPEADTDTDTDTDTDKKERKSRGSRFTLTQPPDDWIFYCKQKRPDLDAAQTYELFSNYWKSKAGKEGVKLDWHKTWQNWVINQRGQINGNYAKSTKDDRARAAIMRGAQSVGFAS